MRTEWKGVFTALVTPFTEDGFLDEEGLAKLVQRQVNAGIHGLVPCGTTGESPSLTDEEWAKVIEITVREAKDKAWIVAGTGTNNTAKSAARTKFASELGADGGLVITPYYNKPTPAGLVRHFRFVTRENPGFPIMVYNVPGRTGVNLTPETAEELAAIPEVASVKEASGNLAQVWDVVKRIGSDVAVLSGEDGINLPIWENGGVGAVSVVSNIVPELMVEQWNAFEAGNRDRAYEIHKELEALASVLFVETSPAPAKYAFTFMGLPAGDVRPPLAPLRDESKEKIRAVLAKMNLV